MENHTPDRGVTMHPNGIAIRSLCWIVALPLCMATTTAVAQQPPPGKPIRFIVPFGPGGTGDFTARLIGQKLDDALQQRVYVDNRPGAEEIIAAELLVRAPPDGHTVMLATATHVVNPSVRKKLPFDPVSDFAPVTVLTQFPYVILVHPSVQARSVRDLITFASANPDKLTFGTSATLPRLASAWMFKMTRINVTHVPYAGGGPVLRDLAGGHLDAAFAAPAGTLSLIRSGRLKAVGVTSSTRSEFFPGVPTVIEGGVPGYEILGWHSVLAPGGTPRDIITRLNAGFVSVLGMADIKAKFAETAVQVVGNTPDEFARFMQSERTKWSKAVTASGFSPE